MPFPRTPVVLPRATATLAVALLALGLTAPTAAALPRTALLTAAPSAPSPATVTVTGEGSTTATPDLAVIGAGVEAQAKTPQAALNAQNEAASALLKAVRGQGVAERDISTENLSLSPVYDYQDGTSELKGYQAAQSFSIKVREAGRTGKVLQAITDATGTAGRINSVTFAVADPAPLRARARKAAHDDAHTKALQYARLSGHRLGRLVSLTDIATSGPVSPPWSPDAPPGAGAGVPLAPGEVRTTATVTAVYELD